ncbi:hypothetical protein [Pelosinus sp. sgz500959]|uniref:hypothetical protein n=1 Tax=Pelosinus sp. sgz500959 TaxID=3242472 RepID=UPI00366D2330
MSYFKSAHIGIGMMISCSLLLNGCSMLISANKPEIGPAGTPVATKANPPFIQRFMSPPVELYDLEATAGVIFEGIIKNNWSQVESGLKNLSTLWSQAKNLIGDKKGVKAADEAIEKLTITVSEKKNIDSYENLTKFMAGIGEIGKSYKLSPLSDIIGVGNSIRTVSFYVANNDWHSTTAKMKELDNTWGQAKPSMESVGIFGRITTTHSIVKQMKDAVDAENKGSVEEHLANINESMGYIRDYYRNK